VSHEQRGEMGPRAKLTEKDVLEIKARYKPGIRNGVALAKEYGVKATTIYGIVKGKSWKHLK
jgi:hypothetical protein